MKDLVKFDIYDGKKPQIDNKYKYRRVSRWIKVQENCNPGKNNSLWDYVMDGYGYHPYQDKFNNKDDLYLDYFRYNGKTYAIEQFFAFGSIAEIIGHSTGYIENNEMHCISAFDSNGSLYESPLMIELDECGERVRVYEEVEI